eukprot:7282091-Pyramimonas_sp.AAC.1
MGARKTAERPERKGYGTTNATTAPAAIARPCRPPNVPRQVQKRAAPKWRARACPPIESITKSHLTSGPPRLQGGRGPRTRAWIMPEANGATHNSGRGRG